MTYNGHAKAICPTLKMKRLLIFIIIILCACASPPKRSILPSPDRLYSEHELLSILESRNMAVNSVEGKLSSRVTIAGENKNTTELILIKKPDHLRMDILSPFGSPVLTMATDGEDIKLQYHAKNRFFSGKAGEPGIAVILSPSLNIGELILILSGGIPLIKFDDSKSEVTWEKNGYRLIIQNETTRQDILFDGKGLYPLTSVIYDGQERALLSLTMGQYNGIEGFDFPSTIDLFMPLENYEMKIKYSRVSLNENLGLEVFSLSPPEGILVEDLQGLSF
ncbi:MAG: DUF4292 domain-containing protein [bacterium]|nr:DUF4292 domain-containing protein [bacterium]